MFHHFKKKRQRRLTKDVEKRETSYRTKICRQNLNNPFVIRETPRRPYQRISMILYKFQAKYIIVIIKIGLLNGEGVLFTASTVLQYTVSRNY